MNNMIKKRNAGLDFVKGICIILVVLDHAINFHVFPDLITAVFYAIFLNGFFSVSGWLAYVDVTVIKHEFVLKKIKEKFLSLFIPYMVFSLLTILWHIILCVGFQCREVSNQYFGWDLIFRDIFCMLSGLGIGTLWFLPVLFISYVLLILTIYLTNKNKKYQNAFLIVGYVLMVILSGYFENIVIYGDGFFLKVLSKYTYTLHRIMYGYGYMMLGYLLHTLYANIYSKTYKRILIYSSFVLAFIGYVFNIEILFEYSACTLLVLGSVILFNKEYVRLNLEKLFWPIIYCGKNSLAIMIYHYLFLFPLEKMLLKYIWGSGYNGWFFFFINLFTTILMVRILEKNPVAQKLLGKNRKRNVQKYN